MVDINVIKEKLSCVEYAKERGLNISKSGSRCSSPFHAGKNPHSFVCYDDFWYSFSDAKGGDIIDLCAELEFEGNRGSAIAALAERLGLSSDASGSTWYSAYEELGNACIAWHKALRPEDREYLHTRGITDQTIDKLKIGYSAEHGGISVPFWKNHYIYDYTVRRYSGEPRYYRCHSNDGTDRSPWGQDTIPRNKEELWLVEGTFDAIALWQQDVSVLQSVNIQPDMVKSHEKVILAYDNDATGEEYTKKNAMKLFRARRPFAVAAIPRPFKDISEAYAHGLSCKDLDIIEGVSYLASLCKNAQELKDMAIQAAYFMPKDEISSLIWSDNIGFSPHPKVLKAIEDIATKGPTESEVADRIIKEHRLAYINNDGFYIYKKRVWELVPDNVICSFADDVLGKRFSTSRKCSAAKELVKARLCTEDITFNKKPVEVFRNGTLHLDTREFTPSVPDDLSTISFNFDYDPAAECPNWENFIDSVTSHSEQKADVLQSLAGYILFHDCRFQKLFLLIGDGANGKSVYIDTLQHVFSSPGACTFVTPDGLCSDFQRINLKHSRANFATEIDSDFSKAEQYLKAISAGETISACHKNMPYQNFSPRSKLIFAANAMPKAQVIKGLDRRMVFVRFANKYVDNPVLPNEKKKDIFLIDKLKRECSGIFNWIYKGYLSLMRRGEFPESEEQSEYLKSFKRVSDHMTVWFEERGDDKLKSGLQIRKSYLYSEYRSWCSACGIDYPKTRENFFRAVKENYQNEYQIIEEMPRYEGKQVRTIRLVPYIPTPDYIGTYLKEKAAKSRSETA